MVRLSLDVRQFAMMLFVWQTSSRKDLLAFAKEIAIVRGSSGIDQVTRAVSSARVLGWRYV